MNLTSLHTFLTILEVGSLVRAAERLNVTQSTVTARLKVLESDLGELLVTRSKTGALPTSAGLRLKRYAETMGELWRQARAEVAQPGNIHTVCNIGCHPDLWHGLGEKLFDCIRMHQSDVALSVWQSGQTELSTWLNNGLTDVSLGYVPSARAEHSSQALPHDRLVLVSTDPQAPIRFDPGYVFVESGDSFGRWHAATYADADVARIAFGSADLGLRHILAHGGTAYLPQRIAQPSIEVGRLHLIADAPAFERPAFLVLNSNATRSWPWLDQAIQTITDAAT